MVAAVEGSRSDDARKAAMNQAGSYMEFFGLREQPFAPTADPSYFYATQDHKSCLFRLWNSIDERHGIAVVLGNYGTGKTTLLRKLMAGMAADPKKYNTVVLGSPIPSWTSFSLLEAIVNQFGLSPRERTFAAYVQSLNEYLLQNRDRISTLVIDDAQNLNKKGQLELLRLAQNLETPQHKLLNLVCFAQLEWMRVLEAAPNFLQRVNVLYRLSPITIEDLHELIQFRIQQAGADPGRAPRFDEVAVQMIHAYAEGNPRVIVSLCRNSLLLGAQLEQRRITPEMVLHTIEKTAAADTGRLAKVRSLMPGRAAATAPQPASAAVAEAEARKVVVGGSAVFGGARRPVQSASERANELLLQAARARRG